MNSTIHHSADVDIYLNINGERIEVDSCLDNKLWLRNPKDHAACEAELVIVVDGIEQRKRISLPFGLSKNRTLVEYETKLAA